MRATRSNEVQDGNFGWRRLLQLAVLTTGLLLLYASAGALASGPPPDPDTFLTLLESSVPENATTAAAYYDTVDPLGKKTTYPEWLVETGFISSIADYNSTGAFADRPGADVVTVVHQNVADLGFIRRMRIRCEPDCDASNPDIYSVIENYPTFDDAANRTNRLASVTMEWTAAADGTAPSNKFVVFYAYTGGDQRNVGADPFAPNLDGRGNKAIPGLCSSCHGGAPKDLKADGTYRGEGNTNGLFLPLDLDNFAFDPDRPELSRASQEDEYKLMNEIVLSTHSSGKKLDEAAGFRRFSAGHELIEGWYGGPGLPDDTFDGEFIPKGWLPPYAPEEAAELYLDSVAPACRACHANQERSLDFGTYDGFMVFEDAHEELVLQIECGLDDDPGGNDDQAVMPLALQTYDIFWTTNQVEVFKDHIGPVECDD